MTGTSRFDFGSSPNPDPAYQWDTKRKLIRLAEVCAPLSAVLVPNFIWLVLSFCLLHLFFFVTLGLSSLCISYVYVYDVTLIFLTLLIVLLSVLFD